MLQSQRKKSGIFLCPDSEPSKASKHCKTWASRTCDRIASGQTPRARPSTSKGVIVVVAVVQPHSISPSISQTVSFPNANQGLSVRSKVSALARMDVYFSYQEAYSISGSVVSFEFGCVLAGIKLCKLQAIPTSIDIELSLKRKPMKSSVPN